MDNPSQDATPVDASNAESDELAQAFEEQVTGDLTPVPQEEMDALSEATVTLEWLTDLQYTISREGVSSADVQALFNVRDKLKAHGMELPNVVALEEYASYGFTQDRSHLNLSISQEGLAKTIADMVKEWLKWFKEWVIKAVRYARNYQHMDVQVKAKVDRALEVLDKVQKATVTYRNASPGMRDHSAELRDHAKQLMQTTAGLKRNDITLAFLGDTFKWSDLARVRNDALKAVGLLYRGILRFQDYLTGRADSPGVDPHLTSMLRDITRDAESMLVESPDKELLKEWFEGIDNEHFEAPMLKDQREFVSYQFLIEACEKASDFIRMANGRLNTIEQFSAEMSATTNAAIASVNEAYLELYKLIDFFHQVRKAQVSVVNLYYAYWNRAYTIAMEDLMPHRLVPDTIKKQAQKLDAELKATVRSWGAA